MTLNLNSPNQLLRMYGLLALNSSCPSVSNQAITFYPRDDRCLRRNRRATPTTCETVLTRYGPVSYQYYESAKPVSCRLKSGSVCSIPAPIQVKRNYAPSRWWHCTRNYVQLSSWWWHCTRTMPNPLVDGAAPLIMLSETSKWWHQNY